MRDDAVLWPARYKYASCARKLTTIDARPECLSGMFEVTISVTVLQPLTIKRVAPRAKNSETRFIHSMSNDYRLMTPTSFGFNCSVTFTAFPRLLITKVLFSPKLAHGPRGTSLKSTNRQSVT